MRVIHIGVLSKPYDVLLGKNILNEVGPQTRKTAGGSKAFVVSNVNVDPLYGEIVNKSLRANGYKTSSMIVGSGETIKNMTELANLLENIAAAGLTRDDVIVALGGGVVGDLAGFAASVYMRGCKIVQVPTSLLAMVDSSVGGKTGVDLHHGKNLAGTFFQPSTVVISLNCLKTIPSRLFNDSIGEVLKYSIICDKKLFHELTEFPLSQNNLDYKRLEKIVMRCIEIKRDIVIQDEKEHGVRQILNLGHTIGHAIEAESNYQLGHGACVAAGMCYIARACAKLGKCSFDTANVIQNAVSAYGLPTIYKINPESLFKRALIDKKRHKNMINVVLIKSIGSVEVRPISLQELREIILVSSIPLEE